MLADESDGRRGKTDAEIADVLVIGSCTVSRVRRRFVFESLEAALQRRPQPPRPDKIKIQGDVEQQLINLACSNPPEGRARWNLQLLADQLVMLTDLVSVGRETVRLALKKDIQPWLVKTWCIPPKANAEFVRRMEDVLEVYSRPYDPDYPMVCVDESSKQLIGEIAQPQPVVPGNPQRIDYEYERLGVCNLFMICEPLRGWRHVKVAQRRTRQDWAECMKELVDVHYPHAKKVILVEDNLNTHDGASLYETYPAAEARRILERLEFHSTP